MAYHEYVGHFTGPFFFINQLTDTPMVYDSLILNPGVNYQALYLNKTVLTGTSPDH